MDEDTIQKINLIDFLSEKPHGLFPPRDPLLKELAEDPTAHPFEKHLAGESSPYELLKHGSWTSGDEAAQAGFDMRLFYKEKGIGEQHGSILGAARLGDRASIGNGYWMSAHGGAVESLLDEATAELGKMEFSPMLSTIEADFKIKKSVPLHTTLRIECQIKEIKGMRCWVDGVVKDMSGVLLASCVAQLVDLQQLWAAQGQSPP
ncbi:g5030 [Coccomyxa elongata]